MSKITPNIPKGSYGSSSISLDSTSVSMELPARFMRKSKSGKIRTAALCKSRPIIAVVLSLLLVITVFTFAYVDFGNINFARAIPRAFENIGFMFGQPLLRHVSFSSAMQGLLITFSLGVLSTIFGAIIAFFVALACARNLSNPRVSSVVRGVVSAIRAVPSILMVLIFTIGVGLGGTAAVAGLSLASAAFLVKAYSESIEEIDSGTIEALRAAGAGFWQIVFQAVFPSVISYLVAWTFLRFEQNFINAIAMGAAAGAGGIGFDLFMAGSFYFDMRELGAITYIIMISVILLELIATRIKAKVK